MFFCRLLFWYRTKTHRWGEQYVWLYELRDQSAMVLTVMKPWEVFDANLPPPLVFTEPSLDFGATDRKGCLQLAKCTYFDVMSKIFPAVIPPNTILGIGYSTPPTSHTTIHQSETVRFASRLWHTGMTRVERCLWKSHTKHSTSW